MEGTMAVVTNWAADFQPKNWAYCNGQTLSISQNSALFSLLGTTYGGDGVTTFRLPDMRGRTAVSQGTLSGSGSNYVLGENGGVPTTSLTVNNIPPHNHNGQVTLIPHGNATTGGDNEPSSGFPGLLNNGYSPVADTTMAAPTYSGIVGPAGSGLPYSSLSPVLVVNYIICMYGIYPSRS